MMQNERINSCSGYRLTESMLTAGQVAEYEDLRESDRLPELSTLNFDARAELAIAVIARIEGIDAPDPEQCRFMTSRGWIHGDPDTCGNDMPCNAHRDRSGE